MEVKRQYAYFSAAIRDGLAKFPEVHGPYYKRDATGEICGACVIGAGLAMCGFGDAYELERAFPYMSTVSVCPEGDVHDGGNDLIGIAISLFEFHRWSRERVVDWLYAEEEKLGFVTISTDETEALKPQVGFINNAAEAQAGVLTKRF